MEGGSGKDVAPRGVSGSSASLSSIRFEAFEINSGSGRRLVTYTDSIFDGNSDESPKQMPPSQVHRPIGPSKIQTPNQQVVSQSAYLAHKRPLANSDLFLEGAGESSKQIRSPIHGIPRSDEPSEMHYQNAPKKMRSSSPKRDFMHGGRKPLTCTDPILGDTSVEPSKENQPSKGIGLLPRAAQRPVRPFEAQTSYSNAPKRNRSPAPHHDLGGRSAFQAPAGPLSKRMRSPIDEILREEEAKVRRLARFGAELSQPAVVLVGPPASKADSSKQQADINISEATTIVGLCPDMCPAQTLICVQYKRAAERDPHLIRPLPVLMKTMDYLLELLDRPYDDEFLGLYNFLWDRMRAVRMDLRMQRIFSLEAISMLEQMIRLHIICMHELCEYNKDDRFSERFDAHLNIEQMNKASVELFQMYEHHRRKGKPIPTEKEFRGYYALLKLDKHPGYKVEPAELSLDLAKMAPEVRRSPEISFARDVAKACRMGNYISFFKLAKKATYLQACLMHAHFSKVRTEALASLYSSFQRNQGMPLDQLEVMLAMEGEETGNFLEHHGVAPIKCSHDKYIVKDGSFVKKGDLPSKRSPLVGNKKFDKIKMDVCFTPVSGPQAVMLKALESLSVGPLPRTSEDKALATEEARCDVTITSPRRAPATDEPQSPITTSHQ